MFNTLYMVYSEVTLALTFSAFSVNISIMSEQRSNKKSRLENFKLFYEAVPIPEIDPNRDVLEHNSTSSRAPRGKRVSRPRN